jgi:P27 family predicted phage terminase small subunit
VNAHERGGVDMTGRKPVPTHLKILNGNPGKRPLPANEPKPIPQSPKRPTWLNKEGKRAWGILLPELERLGLMTVVDGQAFAAACQSYGTWAECQKILKETGYTYEYENKNGAVNVIARPEILIGDKALSQFKSFCVEFGLTPSSRSRINLIDTETGDELSELLSGVK